MAVKDELTQYERRKAHYALYEETAVPPRGYGILPGDRIRGSGNSGTSNPSIWVILAIIGGLWALSKAKGGA